MKWNKIRFHVTAIDRKIVDAFEKAFAQEETEDGGAGSGNWGHKGRPGKRGGSGQGGGKKYRSQKEDGTFERKKLEDPTEMAGKYTNGKRAAFQGKGQQFTPSGKKNGSIDPNVDPVNASVESVKALHEQKKQRIKDLSARSMDVSMKYSRKKWELDSCERTLNSMSSRAAAALTDEDIKEAKELVSQIPNIEKRLQELSDIVYSDDRPERGTPEYTEWRNRKESARVEYDEQFKSLQDANSARSALSAREKYDEALAKRDSLSAEVADLDRQVKSISKESEEAKADLEQYKKKLKTRPDYMDKIYKSSTRERLETSSVTYNPPKKYAKQLTDSEIVDRLGGGDRTVGSCASLALAYVGCKSGLDVLDFRGGDSQKEFSHNFLSAVMLEGFNTQAEYGHGDYVNGKNLLKKVEAGKEYILCTGRHAAVVRRTQEGKLQYLELQSGRPGVNGWTDFGEKPDYILFNRFGCSRAKTYASSTLTDVESMKGNVEFNKVLGYINTSEGEQRKGKNGTIK